MIDKNKGSNKAHHNITKKTKDKKVKAETIEYRSEVKYNNLEEKEAFLNTLELLLINDAVIHLARQNERN